MNIAIFGGTFDPIHAGHLRAARAAARRFQLDRVLFVPCGVPPHKLGEDLAPFPHRFAMVALASQGEPAFVPSLLEAPKPDRRPNYSVETAEAVRRMLASRDRLYFILGVDSFLDLPNWKDYQRLCELANFIVASRPGFGSRKLMASICNGHAGKALTANGSRLPLPTRMGVHVLSGVRAAIASREIRSAARAGKSLAGLVPPLVEEYIRKEELYRSGRNGRAGRGGK
ncbi:MAG TPA: nicotinate-nucleotide adenylyltransferase [Terriglobia bacterium]|nr:nicotinate-nucleotide adenylyltransferase [Terriglobia bacterium]